jgi:hypothetical protein
MIMVANMNITTDLDSALDSGEPSDFTITYNGQIFKVHKAIVCAQSETFGLLAALAERKRWRIRWTFPTRTHN